MTLRFKGAELRPAIAEAVANQCRIIQVKDQGAYWPPSMVNTIPIMVY